MLPIFGFIIHPFDDDNERITRAITGLILSILKTLKSQDFTLYQVQLMRIEKLILQPLKIHHKVYLKR